MLKPHMKSKLNYDLQVLVDDGLSPQQTQPPINESIYFKPLEEKIAATSGFKTHTPLFYYLVQESVLLGDEGRQLGPLGSYILALTIGAALYRSQLWGTPTRGGALAHAKSDRGVRTMPDLIAMLDMDDDAVLARRAETI